MKKEKILYRIIIAILGLMISGVGVGIFLYSGKGVDPASVFQTGLANVFGIGYGTASALSNIFILVVVFLVDKSYINISSFLAIFSIGYTADLTSYILRVLIKGQSNFIISFSMLFIGCILMGIGIATYIRAGLGVGAIDMVSEVISDKSGISYRMIRIICDTSFVVIGFILGGVVGIGTIIAAFLTGPVVQLVRPKVYQVVDKTLESVV